MSVMKFEDRRPFETADEIIQSCRQIAVISKSRLAKWHRAGLIEKPTTVALGRGRGSESRYPLGTRKLVTVIARMPKRTKAADLIWDLWWEGYAIPPATVRR